MQPAEFQQSTPPAPTSPASTAAIASVQYPDKFHLALRYAEEGPLKDNLSLSSSDKLLLYALAQQAVHGPCQEPKPSIWAASEAKAKWNAWRELGERSKMEAMFKYVQAMDEFAPAWWEWPDLGVGQQQQDEEKERAYRTRHTCSTPSSSSGTNASSDGPGPAGDADETSDDADEEQAKADERMLASLDERLAQRASAPPPDAASAAADKLLVGQLARRLGTLLAAPPRQRDVRGLTATIHALASLAALGGTARQQCVDDVTCLDAALVAAMPPAKAGALELPTTVQHLALMLLVNSTINAAGAAHISRNHEPQLQRLAEAAEDPRSRSLARCVLDNVAQHAGLLHHITRRSRPGKLQLATPSSMLQTFARLESSCHSAPPPCMPGNRRLPSAPAATEEEESDMEAAVEAAAAAAEAAAAEAEAKAEAAAAAAAAEAEAAAAAAAKAAVAQPLSPTPTPAVAATLPVQPQNGYDLAAAASLRPRGLTGLSTTAVAGTAPPLPLSSAASAASTATPAASPPLLPTGGSPLPPVTPSPNAAKYGGHDCPMTPATGAGAFSPAADQHSATRVPSNAAGASGASGTPSAAAVPSWAVDAMEALRGCATDLHTLLELRPVARATACWGRGRLGVVLSSFGYALQHVQRVTDEARSDDGSSTAGLARRPLHMSADRDSRRAGKAVHALAAHAHDAHASACLFTLLRLSCSTADAAGEEGCLWCLASLAHVCGGRAMRLGETPEHEEALVAALSSTSSSNCVLFALSALQAAAADPLSVRRVARHLKRVQELFRSENTEIALHACAVVANVEQYSHARLWYARPHTEASRLLDAPAPPPPPPLVLYSQAPAPPTLLSDVVTVGRGGAGGEAGAGAGGDGTPGVLDVPRLACQLHPWVQPSIRRSAVLRLARVLLAAWHRGAHDAVLLYLLDASLVPRRLGFVLSRDLPADDPARHACLFALSLVPLLGGAPLIASEELLQQRLLPVCVGSSAAAVVSPAGSALALYAIQNATADPRVYETLIEAGVLEALMEAAATLPQPVSAIACGAIANLDQLRQRAEEVEALEPPAPAMPRRPDLTPRYALVAPTPPRSDASQHGGSNGCASSTSAGPAASTAGGCSFSFTSCGPSSVSSSSVLASLGVVGVSHRGIPQLCCQMRDFCPLATRRRAVSGLAEVLRSRSLDAGSALELLRRCGAVNRLLELLYESGGGGGGLAGGNGEGGAAAAAAEALSNTSGRVAPPPTQPDAALRDGCLHLLTLIAHLGGLDILRPLNRITAALGGALVSTEPSARAQAAEFWRAATLWESTAGALARAIFPLGGVRSAGVRVEGSGAFTNGVAVLLALTRREHEGGWGTSLPCAQAAAAALVNTLTHPSLRPIWATPTLGYLIKLDDEQVARIMELPARLASREQ